MIKRIEVNIILFYVALLVLSSLIIFHIYTIYAFPSLGPDSGFYLKTAYDLANGLEFYNNFNNSYTPLAMYINSLPFYVFSNVSLELMFSFFLLIYLILSILFYKISSLINVNKKVNVFGTFLFISMLFLLEGVHILLEPYVLLFQFLAIYFLLKYKYSCINLFLVGLFTFLSFYSKQYGLFIVPGVIFLLYVNSDSLNVFFRRTAYLFFGIIIPVCFLITYFCFYKGLNMSEFLFQMIGIPALNGDQLITNIGYTFKGLTSRLIGVFRIFPFVFLLILLIPFIKRKLLSRNIVFVIILFISSLGVLLFAYYPHYFQLIIPYLILVIISVIKKIRTNVQFGVFLLFLIFLKGSYSMSMATFNYKKNTYKEQQANLKILNRYLHSGERVYLQAISPAYYFLCKYDSPNFGVLGYKFPIEITLKCMANSIMPGGYIIADKELEKNDEFKSFELFSKVSLVKKKILILKKKETDEER